jgi:hypothetical protein
VDEIVHLTILIFHVFQRGRLCVIFTCEQLCVENAKDHAVNRHVLAVRSFLIVGYFTIFSGNLSYISYELRAFYLARHQLALIGQLTLVCLLDS